MFRPSGPPAGNSLQEMKENYLRLRDEELAAHICAEHPARRRQKVQMFNAAPSALPKTRIILFALFDDSIGKELTAAISNPATLESISE
jgi:hypothetical protein